MIKLVTLDLDGTLLDDRGEIPWINISALRKISGKGVLIALSSGRMTDCVAPVGEILGIDCALVVYNGAMVRARKEEKSEIIFHCPLPSYIGDMVLEYSLENKFHLNYYLHDKLYAQEDKNLKRYAQIYSRQTGAVFHFLKDLRTLKGNSPTKLILITDPENPDITRTRDYQYDYWKGRLAGEVNLFKTNPEYLEFLHPRVDKGVGLEKLVEFYGIKREETLAFGDGENDIPMLEFAGQGIALANAGEKVKRVADIVLEWDNNQGGVGKFLEKFL